MKILKLLNKNFFFIFFIYLVFLNPIHAEDNPIDIWNLEKKENETVEETVTSKGENNNDQISVFDMQSDKNTGSIELDENLISKEVKIVGLYDPEEHGLTIDMWTNSDGQKLKSLFDSLEKINLSNDALEIMEVSLLTNAHYPNQNITENEFLKFKSDWLIKNSNLELIEEFLINNQIVSSHPELTRHLLDNYLSDTDLKKTCEFFTKIKEPVEDEYLSKLNLYCLVNYGKNEEAQLILDLKKELGFQDEYFENKMNYLFGYIEEASKEVSEGSVFEFHLAHRTNPDFSFEPNENTPQLIWKYLSNSNLLPDLSNVDINDQNKILIIEKATNYKIFSEKDLFEYYKKFQFNIDQLLSATDTYKLLSPVEARALIYQRALLTSEPELKLKFLQLLKQLFEDNKIGLAFDTELNNFLNEIEVDNVPSDYLSFYNNYSKNQNSEFKKIEYNNNILHQSKWVNYFRGDYSKSEIQEDLKKFLDRIIFSNETLSTKDIIFIESLKSDGVEIPSEYDSLYSKKPYELDENLVELINANEVGTVLLSLIEIIGNDKIENIDEKRLYFISNTLNQINADLIRNKLLLKVLPLKV